MEGWYGIITLVHNSVNDIQLQVRAQHRGSLLVKHLYLMRWVALCRLGRINYGKMSLIWSLRHHFLSLDYLSAWSYSFTHAECTGFLSGFTHVALRLWRSRVSLLVFSAWFSSRMLALQLSILLRYLVSPLCATACIRARIHGSGCQGRAEWRKAPWWKSWASF